MPKTHDPSDATGKGRGSLTSDKFDKIYTILGKEFTGVDDNLKKSLQKACEKANISVQVFHAKRTYDTTKNEHSAHETWQALDFKYNLVRPTIDQKIKLILALKSQPAIKRIGIAKNTIHIQSRYDFGRQPVYYYGISTSSEWHKMGGFTDRTDPFLRACFNKITGIHWEGDYWHGDDPNSYTNVVAEPLDNPAPDERYKLPPATKLGKDAYIHDLNREIDQDIRAALDKIDGLVIGDVALSVPPSAIAFSQRDNHMAYPTIRTEGNPKIKGQASPGQITITVIFPSQKDINQKFRPLLAMFKRTPFVPIYNKFISAMLKPEMQRILDLAGIDKSDEKAIVDAIIKKKEINLTFSHLQMWVALEGISVSTPIDLVDTLQCTLNLGVFNYLPYGKDIGFVRSMNEAALQAEYLHDLNNESMSYDDVKKAFNIDGKDPLIPVIPTYKPWFSEPFKVAYSMIIDETKHTRKYGASLPHDYGVLERYDRDAQNKLVLEYQWANVSFRDIAEIRHKELIRTSKEFEDAFTAAKNLGLLEETKSLWQSLKFFVGRMYNDIKYLDDNLKLAAGRELKLNLIDPNKHDPIYDEAVKILSGMVTVTTSQALFNNRLTGKYEDFHDVLVNFLMPKKDKDGKIPKDKDGNILIDNEKKKAVKDAFNSIVNIVSSKIEELYSGKSKHTLRGTKEYVDLTPTGRTVIDGITATYTNKMVPMSTVACTMPTYQHVGVGEFAASVSIKTSDDRVIRQLRQMMVNVDTTMMMAIMKDPNLFKSVDSRVKIEAPNHLLRTLGIRKAVVQDIHIEPIAGQPGMHSITLNLLQNDLDIGSYESIQAYSRVPKGIVSYVSAAVLLIATHDALQRIFDPKEAILQGITEPRKDEKGRVLEESEAKFGLVGSTQLRESIAELRKGLRKQYESLVEFLDKENVRYLQKLRELPYWGKVVKETADAIVEINKRLMDPGSFETLTDYISRAAGIVTLVPFMVAVVSASPIGIALSLAIAVGTILAAAKLDLEVEGLESKMRPLFFRHIVKAELEGKVVNGLENDITRDELAAVLPHLNKMWEELDLYITKKKSCYPDLTLPALPYGQATKEYRNEAENVVARRSRMIPTPPDFYFAAGEMIDKDVITYAADRMGNQIDLLGRSAVIQGAVSYSDYLNYYKAFGSEFKTRLNKLCADFNVGNVDVFLKQVDESAANLIALSKENPFYTEKLLHNDFNHIVINEINMTMKALATEMAIDSEKFSKYNTLLLDSEALAKIANLPDKKRSEKEKSSLEKNKSLQGERLKAIAGRPDLDKAQKEFGKRKGTIDDHAEVDKVVIGNPDVHVKNMYHNSIRDPMQVGKMISGENKEGVYKNLIEYWGISSPESIQAKFEQYSRLIKCKRQDKTLRMARAFPTFKLYFVDEDKEEWMLFDDFYSYSSVKSIAIIDTKKAIAKTAVVELSNVAGKLTNISRSSQKILNHEKPASGNPDNTEIDSMMLRPGCSIMLKMGYSSDDMDLPVVFQGTVTSVNPGPTVELIAQGWGAELTNPVNEGNGLDIDWKSLAKGHGDIVSKVLDTTKGLEHLGRKKMSVMYTEGETNPRQIALRGIESNLMNALGLGDFATWVGANNPVDDNIYLEYSNNWNPLFHTTFDWRVYPGKTAIEAIKEIQVLYPNYIVKVLPYNDTYAPSCSDIRMTLYVGPKDGYYRYTDDPFSVQTMTGYKNHKSEKEYHENFYDKNDKAAAFQYFHSLVDAGKKGTADKNPLFNNLKELAKKKNGSLASFNVKHPNYLVDLYTGAIESGIFMHNPKTDAQLAAEFGATGDIAAQSQAEAATSKFPITSKELKDAVKKDIRSNPYSFQMNLMKQSHSKVAKQYFRENPWYREVVDYHYISGLNHIISNNIMASADNMHNVVNLGFTNEPPKHVDQGWKSSNINHYVAYANLEIDPDHLRIYDTFHPNLDTNWWDQLGRFGDIKRAVSTKESELKHKDFSGITWSDVPSYIRVANTILGEQMQGMYTGDVITIGDPTIKSYDQVYIDDPVTDMHGTFEVDQVIHRLDAETGFTSTIRPNLLTSVRDMNHLIDTSYINKAYAMANGKFLSGILIGMGITPLAQSVGSGARSLIDMGAKAAVKATTPVTGIAGVKGITDAAELAGYLGSGATAQGLVGEAAKAATGSSKALSILPKAAGVLGKWISPALMLGIAGYSTYKGFQARTSFIIDRMGLMLGNEAISFSPLVYQGRPYTAGLEGYRHDNMMGHFTHMMAGMSPIERFGLVNEHGLMLRYGKDYSSIFAGQAEFWLQRGIGFLPGKGAGIE